MEKRYLTSAFEPRRVLEHFEDICAIPHGSGNEAALAAHIMTHARKNGLDTESDGAGNILVRKPASPGCAAVPPVLLQGHMDMVCVKDADAAIDMEREPIRLILEGNILRAQGTSLGADNAVGLCAMLALMEAHDLIHPPLELLFTTGEEAGMMGMRAFDAGRLRSRRMITMDCGDPDCMVIGCAGSAKYRIIRPATMLPFSGRALQIEIGGLTGGHSGIEAGKNRASAVALAGRLLSTLADAIPVRLAAMDMEGMLTSIPRAIAFTAGVPQSDAACARRVIEKADAAFRAELAGTDPGYRLDVADGCAAEALGVSDTRALADLMLLMPGGVLRVSERNPAWPMCSALLARAVLRDGMFEGLFSIRANRDEYRDGCAAKMKALLRMTGAECEFLGGSPAWPDDSASALQALCGEVYRALFGEPLRMEPVHGAVEAAFLKKALPDMEIAGFAPKSRGAHTTDERLYVDSMQPFWRFLTALLEAMCGREGAGA